MRPENIAKVDTPAQVTRRPPLHGVRGSCAILFNLDQSRPLLRLLGLKILADRLVEVGCVDDLHCKQQAGEGNRILRLERYNRCGQILVARELLSEVVREANTHMM